jgi:hypothetical protein
MRALERKVTSRIQAGTTSHLLCAGYLRGDAEWKVRAVRTLLHLGILAHGPSAINALNAKKLARMGTQRQ